MTCKPWLLFLVSCVHRHLALLHFELHDRVLGILDIRIMGTTLSFRALFWNSPPGAFFPLDVLAEDGSADHQVLSLPLSRFFPAPDFLRQASIRIKF